MDRKESEICTFAFFSRVFLLILQCAANAVIPDHDAGVFLPPKDESAFSWIDRVLHFLFGGLQRWDAVYFSHIMQHGYVYQNSVAFFPFFPLVSSSISSVLQMFGILHPTSWILLTSIVLNLMLFVLTSVMLYRLGKLIVSADVAYYGAMIFCINPASVFMTAPYSEIMYMFFLILALLRFQIGALFSASFLIGLCVFTRSNGTVNIGFILHAIAKSFIFNLTKLIVNEKLKTSVFVQSLLCLFIWTITKIIVCLVLSLAPFVIYQYYIYRTFCLLRGPSDSLPADVINYGRSQGYHLAGDVPAPPWCHDFLPLSYLYVQKHHWDVGFLSYYQIKQLPNFLLAAPAVLISFETCRKLFSQNPRQYYTLGLVKAHKSSPTEHKSDSCGRSSRSSPVADSKKTEEECTVYEDKMLRSNTSEDIVVHVFHLMGLVLFGCCLIHIQVLTRLLWSSSPLLYWYCGAMYVQTSRKEKPKENQFMTTNKASSEHKSGQTRTSDIWLSTLSELSVHFITEVIDRWSVLCIRFRAVFIYCVIYFVVGTIMFSNFLPWT